MIYASGVVTLLLNNKASDSIKKLKSRTVSLEVIEEITPADSNGSTGKIICKYTAILPRSFECKTLEDYTGKIKPFLQKSIDNVIISVQVSHLNYASAKVINSNK